MCTYVSLLLLSSQKIWENPGPYIMSLSSWNTQRGHLRNPPTPVLLTQWQAALYEFKAYSIITWLTYIVKWQPQ